MNSKSTLSIQSTKTIDEEKQVKRTTDDKRKVYKKQQHKENSPKKKQSEDKLSSPFKTYKSPVKKTLQPYLPDRESPSKCLQLTASLAELQMQPIINKPTLIESRKLSQDISDFLKLDVPLISFGKFISGKTLGSTLTVTNTSNEKKFIVVSMFTEVFNQSY